MKKRYVILFILFPLFLVACREGTIQNDSDAVNLAKDYEECTTICSAAMSEEFTVVHLCNEECKRRFLNNGSTTTS